MTFVNIEMFPLTFALHKRSNETNKTEHSSRTFTTNPYMFLPLNRD